MRLNLAQPVRCLTLLRLFVEEVEAKLSGIAEPARRHGTVVRGTTMRMNVTVVGGSNSPKLEVVIDSNQTVAALRLRIWQQLADHAIHHAAVHLDFLRFVDVPRVLD